MSAANRTAPHEAPAPRASSAPPGDAEALLADARVLVGAALDAAYQHGNAVGINASPSHQDAMRGAEFEGRAALMAFVANVAADLARLRAAAADGEREDAGAVAAARYAVVAALYFDDSSDFRTYLWDALKALAPDWYAQSEWRVSGDVYEAARAAHDAIPAARPRPTPTPEADHG